MLENHLRQLASDLECSQACVFDESNRLTVDWIEGMPFVIEKAEMSFLLSTRIAQVPSESKESFFILLMKGNLLGQEVGESCLSLDPEGQFVFLNLQHSYDVGYAEFKEIVEEFVNYSDYWKKRVKEYLELKSNRVV